ncbi:MAG: MCE family protein [Chlorobiaceae bacterium]|nr:MCE family protein [Chlorobiaceae bacterium]NTW11507.1 MCE family protein [Chlorobiaceae bacterium]
MKNPNALKWSDLKTGIFFILGIGFAAYLGLVIGKNTNMFTGVTTIKVLSQDMQSLAENNFVSISGKRIGTVSKMGFLNRNDSLFVVAELKLKNEFAPLVTKDSRATIKSLGILGDKFIDIKTGKGSKVKEGDYIALQTEDSMSNLTDKAASAFEKINVLLDHLNSGKGMAGRIVSDEKMGTDLVETVANLKAATSELSTLSKKASHGEGLLPKLLNDKTLANNTTQTIDRLNKAAQQTETLIGRINDDKGTLGQLTSNPALYNNLTHTLTSLDSVLVDLKRKPGRYVKFSLF